MNSWNLWKLGVSWFHLQLAQVDSLEIDIHVEWGCFLKSLTLRAPGRLIHIPFFVIGSLYWSTSGINEYSSRKLLVNGSPVRDSPMLVIKYSQPNSVCVCVCVCVCVVLMKKTPSPNQCCGNELPVWQGVRPPLLARHGIGPLATFRPKKNCRPISDKWQTKHEPN